MVIKMEELLTQSKKCGSIMFFGVKISLEFVLEDVFGIDERFSLTPWTPSAAEVFGVS